MKERGQRKMFSCQKHFSKVNPVQNDNNNNKIVVKKFQESIFLCLKIFLEMRKVQ